MGWFDSNRPLMLLGVKAADLQGWVTADAKRPASPDLIEFRLHVPGKPDRLFATLPVSRPDVALALGNAALRRSGYQAFISLAADGQGAYVNSVLTYGQEVIERENLPLLLRD